MFFPFNLSLILLFVLYFSQNGIILSCKVGDSMEENKIVIKGARENNLKNLNIEIPKNKLVVITGVSGSGKSTLAFDTIYAEGQRRYVESLSSYARQFLGGMEKPDVDSIEGLSPAISIDQKTTSHNPRSTVGTVTEIYDYLRLLFARIGTPYCPIHNTPIQAQTLKQMLDKIMEYQDNSKLIIMSPVVRGEKGTHKDLFSKLMKNGFTRVKVDGETYLLEEVPELDKNKKHHINIVVDRLKKNDSIRGRLAESLEVALKWANGIVIVDCDGDEILFSEHYSCIECGFSLSDLEPRLFSFNAPYGACPDCHGIGSKMQLDIDLLIPNMDLSINQGGIRYYKNIVNSENIEWQEFDLLLKTYNIDKDKPLKDFTKEEMHYVLYGSDRPMSYSIESRSGNVMKRTKFLEGVKVRIEHLFNNTTSDLMRDWYRSFMSEIECSTCNGKRLSEKALCVKIDNKNIYDVTTMSIGDCLKWFNELKLDPTKAEIAKLIIKEIKSRLLFLKNVGLEYLTLSRSAGTLSGGESQRIRLATQIGSRLTGVLYVLDEPSIGLHQRDNERLIHSLQEMRDLGNTLIVVEHDEDTMLAADWLIDIGPGAGTHGGKVVAQGTPKDVMNVEKSITAQYLTNKKKIERSSPLRIGNGNFIEIYGASQNNLKNIDVKIPLGCLTLVTGVSGSGKSSLVNEILYKAVAGIVNKSKIKAGKYQEIKGVGNIDKVVQVSQDAIGRSPRSNPATYIGVFDDIRDLYSSTIEAKVRGYEKGRFSFNVKGGRCERCQGDGVIRVPMNFLPDVYVPCEECHGKRYNDETLEIYYKEKNIADVLDMRAEEAYTFFEGKPKIQQKIKTLVDVGLGYVKLGQSATTLSGGEAQRVKLAYELQKRSTGKTLYILDEPTTGLHLDDVKKLMIVLNKIVDNGNSVVIIEHNLDVIKLADYIIDLGPEGGDKGGNIVFEGTVDDIIKCKQSYTGKYLKHLIDKKRK